MNYIDKNVILCYLNKNDLNHDKAAKLWAINEPKVISKITLPELRSVLSRKTNLSEAEIEAYVTRFQALISKQAEICKVPNVFILILNTISEARLKTLFRSDSTVCKPISGKYST